MMPQERYCTLCAGAVILAFIAFAFYLDPTGLRQLNPFGAEDCSSYKGKYSPTEQQNTQPNLSRSESAAAQPQTEGSQGDYYACQLARYTHHLALFTAALAIATTLLFGIGIYQGMQSRRGVGVAARAAAEARDAITATQASAEAANTHARAAEEANRINREVLIASQRAWVRVVDAKIGGGQPLRFDENGASTSIAYTIENIGNAPALYITIRQWLVVFKGGQPVSQIQQEKCEPIRRSGFAYGFTLFPNEMHPAASGYHEYSFGVAVSKQDVEDARRVTVDGKYVILHVVGCIDYTFPSDPTVHHQTRFLYELRKTSLAPISPDEGVIDPANLILQPDALGAGRYAD